MKLYYRLMKFYHCEMFFSTKNSEKRKHHHTRYNYYWEKEHGYDKFDY
jgi:hypothetical protein